MLKEIYGAKVAIMEPEINHEASEFLVNNYEEMFVQAKKMGITEDKAFDLVHDVYVSLVKGENNGEGYDSSHGGDGSSISVAQFVYGRMKKYAKNAKYRTDIVQKLAGSQKGQAYSCDIIASSSLTDDLDAMDSFQKAFAMAGTYDDLETIEDELSVKELMEYCVGFDSIVGIRMDMLFKNMSILRNPDIDKSFFSKLTDAIQYHNEFGEAFHTVVDFYAKHTDRFEYLAATI